MTQLKPTENIFAVEVPKDAFSFRIDGNGIEPLLTALLSELTENKAWNKIWNYPLPPGPWSFVGTSEREDDCKKVVEEGFGVWRDYAYPDALVFGYSTALESFQSLLKSKGLDPSKRYAILKQG